VKLPYFKQDDDTFENVPGCGEKIKDVTKN
jgi:hypothetical protein